MVFNKFTYPNFTRFLEQYQHMELSPSPMSLSVSRDGGALEWASMSLSTVFSQRFRVFDKQMWRFLYDLLRFNACAQALVDKWKTSRGDSPEHAQTLSDGDITLKDYLIREGYSPSFLYNYIIVSYFLLTKLN